MKSEDAKPKNVLREPSHATWSKLFVSVNEEASKDVVEAAPSGNLARIFVGLLLAHVLLIGACVAYNLISEHTRWENAVSVAPLVKLWNSLGSPSAKIEGAAQESKPETTFGMQEYEVGSGDSIPSIAQKFGVYAAELIRVNHLDNGGEIYPGRKLSIPAKTQAMNDLIVARQTAPAFVVRQSPKLAVEDMSAQVNFPLESLPVTALAEAPATVEKNAATPEMADVKETLVEHPRLEDVLIKEPSALQLKSAATIALAPIALPLQPEVAPTLDVTRSSKIVKNEGAAMKGALKPTLAEMPYTAPKKVEEPLITSTQQHSKSLSKTAPSASSLNSSPKPVIAEVTQARAQTIASSSSSAAVIRSNASSAADSPLPEEARINNSIPRAARGMSSPTEVATAPDVAPPPAPAIQEDVPKAILVERVPKAILVEMPDETEKIQNDPPSAEKKAVRSAVAATKEKAAEKKSAAKPVAKPLVDNRVAASRFYTTTSRDTWITVARKFQVRLADLIRVNSMKFPSKLHEGEKLKIPAKSSSSFNNVAGDLRTQNPWYNQENGRAYGPRYGSRYYVVY